jgi:hypothetical protein
MHPTQFVVHDYADNLSDLGRSKQSSRDETDALVASGDYFATVATILDHISQSLAKGKHAEHATLERLISELLYVQRNYYIGRK